MFLVSSCSCLCPIHWSQVLNREWSCSWSSSDRWCSNYIWVINNFIAYWGAIYIRGLTVCCKCMSSYNTSLPVAIVIAIPIHRVTYIGFHRYTNLSIPKFGITTTECFVDVAEIPGCWLICCFLSMVLDGWNKSIYKLIRNMAEQ